MTTRNEKTKHYIHQRHKRKKTAVANKTIYTLVWYALYDLWPGNGLDPILTAPEPTHGASAETSNWLHCYRSVSATETRTTWQTDNSQTPIYCHTLSRDKKINNYHNLRLTWVSVYGLTSYSTHRSFWKRVFPGQMTKPTVSKHWRKTGWSSKSRLESHQNQSTMLQ